MLVYIRLFLQYKHTKLKQVHLEKDVNVKKGEVLSWKTAYGVFSQRLACLEVYAHILRALKLLGQYSSNTNMPTIGPIPSHSHFHLLPLT